MRQSVFTRLVAIAAVLCAAAAVSRANIIMADPVTPVVGPFTYTSTGAGYFFRANASGTAQINQLGYEDPGGDGLATSHDIGLFHWNETNYTLIAKATVPAGTAATLVGGYRWVDVPAITLTDTRVGDYYAIVATYNGIDPTYEGEGSVSNTLGGTAIGTITGNGYAAPVTNVGDTYSGGVVNYQWGGANARFVVPEPTGAAILVIGGVGLLVRRTRTPVA